MAHKPAQSRGRENLDFPACDIAAGRTQATIVPRVCPASPFNRQIDFLAIRKFQITLIDPTATALNDVSGSHGELPGQLPDFRIGDRTHKILQARESPRAHENCPSIVTVSRHRFTKTRTLWVTVESGKNDRLRLKQQARRVPPAV
jgi:hypothetical protein